MVEQRVMTVVKTLRCSIFNGIAYKDILARDGDSGLTLRFAAKDGSPGKGDKILVTVEFPVASSHSG